MTDLSEVFSVLDPGNKGYIQIDEFKEKLEKHLNIDLNTDESTKIKNFVNTLNPDADGKIYFCDFKEATKLITGANNPDVEVFSSTNDADSHSTGDSGFSMEPRNQGFRKGKSNRRLIKYHQNPEIDLDTSTRRDLCQNGDNLISQDLYYQHKGSHPDLTQDSSRSIARRQRDDSWSKTDFVSYSNHSRLSSRSDHLKNREDESASCCGYSSCGGSAANLYYNDSMTDIQQKLSKMEQSMEHLQLITSKTKVGRPKKLDDAQHYLSQIQALEDKLRDQQKRFEKELISEREMTRKHNIKLDQLKQEEVDSIKESLKAKELELDFVKREMTNINAESERLKYDNLRTEDKLSDLQLQKSHMEAEMKRMKELHKREMELLVKERRTSIKMESEVNSESNMANLRQDNHRLRLRLEESEAELLALSVERGQSVLQSISADPNWMTEVDGYSKQEVIDMLVKEKDANYRLREYITSILTRIIDKDPTLLEIS